MLRLVSFVQMLLFRILAPFCDGWSFRQTIIYDLRNNGNDLLHQSHFYDTNETTLQPTNRPAFVSTTSLSAEWEKEWKETNFEADLAKLQKEAEERLDEKISELQANIEKTGA